MMKKRILKIIIPIVIILVLIVVIIERNFIQKTSDFMFYLEEKYYGDSVFNEIESNDLSNLINDKESFAIFIHQPFCSTSYEFNKILTKFAEENKISFYKMSFNEMKKTVMYKNIKYYPSFAIYNNGKLIDFLEADSDEDLNRYKHMEEFKNWFSSYVQMKEYN
jgi:thiol-disulfide isomerase/thioredoxin